MARRLPRSPRFWLGAFLLWWALLWVLSSLSHPAQIDPPFEYFDKIEHFGYFFGGAGLLSAWLYRKDPKNPNWRMLVVTAVVILSLIGWLDEYYQSFTPGRSGNDPYDWLADLAGAVGGAFVFKRIHYCLK